MDRVISVAPRGGIILTVSMLGFVPLCGVVPHNGLLQVNHYNDRLAKGQFLKRALFEGSRERLVAILLTALSSALGMVPLVLGNGTGQEILHPLALIVLGSLCISTALILVVIPSLYLGFSWCVPQNPLLKPQKESLDNSAFGAIKHHPSPVY